MSNTAIQKAETGAIVASTPGQIITGLAALIATPGLGIEAMSAILAAEERMVDRQAEREFNQAMCDCQDEMVPVVRDATNQHTKSKYARLETIDRQIRPIYTKHGFALSFSNPTMSDGKHLIECKVMHRGGHTETKSITLANDALGAKGGGNKTEVQGAGSTMSYARKYIKLMVFDIVLTDEDNDGQGMPDYITQDQSLTICDLLAACGVSQSDENFLAWAAAKSVATITKSNYAKVINGLKKKLTEAK